MIPEPKPVEYATKQDLQILAAEFKTLLAEAKVDIIRWNIVTMLGFAGILAAVLKLVP